MLVLVHPVVEAETPVHVPAIEIPGVLDLLQLIINAIRTTGKSLMKIFIDSLVGFFEIPRKML